MKYNYEFDMKYTDNPYIDLIVQCVKILGMNCVVKNENEALHYEDVRSAREATDYIKFKEGYWNERRDGMYNEWSYMEWNSYYRMLNGEPPAYTLNDEKAYLEATGYEQDEVYVDIGKAWVIPDLYERYFIPMGQYTVPEDMPTLKLEGKYLHELTQEELSMIESCGIMKQVLVDYSNDAHYQYIYHLGDKRVDYYTARKAVNFSLLWIPELNTFDIIEHKFRRVFDRNRKYTMATVYSEAYRFMSYHYDAFIEILIIIQTMVDMISEVQEYIINKDVFDTRTIRYLFESYGIPYYKEIPVKYQIRIIKNVNTLLKYKSSHRNITDILELFDDDSIVVYTYYLMKTKKLNRNDFFYYTEDDVNPKYNTNRDYWIGNPKDISNNKIPLTNVKYNEDETDFIQSHIYAYELKEDGYDISSNRLLSDEQPIASLITRPLESLTTIMPTNSFVDTFMRDSKVNWFGVENYLPISNSSTQNINYLANRSNYLAILNSAITNRIKTYFDNMINTVPDFALNKYYYRRIKYELYGILGIFNRDICDSSQFDSMTDLELEEYFYQEDTLITPAYRKAHNLEDTDEDGNYIYFNEDSEDRFMLNHTIPYMVYFDYKRDESIENVNTYIGAYMFNNDNSFSVNIGWYPDSYDIWTRMYRKNYIVAIRNYIEGVFADLEVDPVNNPTPNYIGWMDLNYVLGQLDKTISELEIGDKVTTKNNPNIPIYTSAYVYEVITEDMVGQEFFRKNYDLCFLKVPILDPNAYKVLERYDMRRNYDAITLADPFWDGVSTFDLLTDEERSKLHQSKRQEILNKEFTIERTKYIAVEASIDLTKMSYQISYFMNMLYDKHKDEEDLYLDIDPEVVSSGRVRLNDILSFAIALNYLYQGVEPDVIATDMEKNMYINGFNFDNDWTDIYNYLQNQHHIYNNYLNDLHDYDYTDEFGVSHHVRQGFGMNPLEKGYMTELYEDFYVYKDDIKTYLGNPIYGYSENGDPLYYWYDAAVKPEGYPINPRGIIDGDKVIVNDPDTGFPIDTRVGAFLSGRYEQCADDCITSAKFELDFGYSDIWCTNLRKAVKYDFMTGDMSTIDISWRPTQYPNDDNNSHGLWLDTAILPLMDENSSDLERINMLKKIYYSNTNLYDHLTYMLRHAESKRMYDIYKVVYDSYMETKMSYDYYRLKDSDGNAIYTDKNDNNSSYRIKDYEYTTIDEEGFPVFIGEKLDDEARIVSSQRYTFSHNEDFTDCKYIGEDGHTVDCIYNKRKLRDEGIKEYIVTDMLDYERQKIKPYFFSPQEEGYQFRLDNVVYKFLENINNPEILILIELDEDGNVTIPETTFRNVTVEHVRDEDGNETGEIKVTIISDDGEVIEKIMDLEWKIASDYYELLQYRNSDLYSHLIDLKYNYANIYDPVKETWVPSDEKRQRIETLCELIVIALEKYFDKNEWRWIFNLIPTANIKNIQNYIMKMVIFFKSWKTQIIDTAVTYVIDDPYNNHVHILDDMYYNSVYEFLEKVRPKEYKYFHNYTEYRDPIKVGEKLDFNEVEFKPYTITIGFGEKIYGHRFDYPEFKSILNFNESIAPREKVEINTVEYTGEVEQDSKGNYLFP